MCSVELSTYEGPAQTSCREEFLDFAENHLRELQFPVRGWMRMHLLISAQAKAAAAGFTVDLPAQAT